MDMKSGFSSEHRERFEQLYKSSKLSVLLSVNLVNDLLDFAKIENASFKIFPTYINLLKKVDKVLYSMEHQANLKGIQLLVRLDSRNKVIP